MIVFTRICRKHYDTLTWTPHIFYGTSVSLTQRVLKPRAGRARKKFHYFTVKGPYLRAFDKLIWPSKFYFRFTVSILSSSFLYFFSFFS